MNPAQAPAGVLAAWLRERLLNRPARAVAAAGLAALATVFPLSGLSLPAQQMAAAGRGFPGEPERGEARILAEVLRNEGLESRPLWSYSSALGEAVAVYLSIARQSGSSGEVRPRQNPPEALSAGAQVYLMPLPPGDDILVQFRIYGLVRIHGGTANTSVVTLTRPGKLDLAAPLAAEVLRQEAAWLAANAVDNTARRSGSLLDPERLEEWRERLWRQRIRVGRMSLAMLTYAYALEPENAAAAQWVRQAARDFGTLAGLLGDEAAVVGMRETRFERLRENLRAVAREAPVLRRQSLPSPEFEEAVSRLFREGL